MKTSRSFTIAMMAASACLVMLTGAGTMAATVILPNGNRVEGTAIRASRNGDIILTTAAGQQTFPRGAYAKAIADKPANFDRARSLASQGKHSEAIALLEQIAEEYRFLEWDINSYITIAKIYSAEGKHADAVGMYDRVVKQSPTLKEDVNFQWAYRSALLSAGSYEKLSPELDKIIASGSRSDAARAQVMRGDIKLAQGQVEAAVMDYLRTAILFEAEKDVQPEALFKAGLGLEQMRDPRARDMFQKLVDNYSSSEYAGDARSKL